MRARLLAAGPEERTDCMTRHWLGGSHESWGCCRDTEGHQLASIAHIFSGDKQSVLPCLVPLADPSNVHRKLLSRTNETRHRGAEITRPSLSPDGVDKQQQLPYLSSRSRDRPDHMSVGP